MRIRLALATALLAAAPSADVLTVGVSGSGADFDRIQLAIDAASAGGVVLVGPGAFDGFLLDKPVSVLCAGPDQTTVEPGIDLSGLLIVVGDVFIDLTAPISLGAFVLDANGEARIARPAPAPLEPTLLTFQWARLGASIELSNPAFISLQ